MPKELVMLSEKQTENKTREELLTGLIIPAIKSRFHHFPEHSTQALFELWALPQPWQAALSTLHNPTIITEKAKEGEKITLKMRCVSMATQESKYSESPHNKCSLYQHDPPCARECCACPLVFVKSLPKSPWRQPAGPPTSTVPTESILALHSCGNKPVYHQRVTHANERLFVFHCAHAGVREFI